MSIDCLGRQKRMNANFASKFCYFTNLPHFYRVICQFQLFSWFPRLTFSSSIIDHFYLSSKFSLPKQVNFFPSTHESFIEDFLDHLDHQNLDFRAFMPKNSSFNSKLRACLISHFSPHFTDFIQFKGEVRCELADFGA